MNVSTVPLCRDCAHCRPLWIFRPNEGGGHGRLDYARARCGLTDRVTGDGEAGLPCAVARAFGECGDAGVNFEQKPAPKPKEPLRTRVAFVAMILWPEGLLVIAVIAVALYLGARQ